MIARLKGTLIQKDGRQLVIDVGGVGYEALSTRACAETFVLGELAELVIYTDVKEDSITLFGFKDQLEKQVFTLLRRVKGIGPRTASELVSQIDKLELLRAISSGDVARIQAARGVGRKMAERIVLELKEKVAEFALESRSSSFQIEVGTDEPYQDALEALKSLGFTVPDAQRALKLVQSKPHTDKVDSALLIREALKYV